MVTPVSCYWLISVKVKLQIICIEYDPSCNATSKAKSALLVALQDEPHSMHITWSVTFIEIYQ